jgi:regulator of RNase E activity RraA
VNQFLRGARPLQSGARACGRAVTVRFGSGRPDLVLPPEALWLAIEALEAGDFLVLDCRSNTRAGIVGDLPAARIKRCRAVGLVVWRARVVKIGRS